MTEIIEVIRSFMSQLPAEFMYTVMLGMMGYLVKRVNQIQKSFRDDIDGLGLQQDMMKEEYVQSAKELKAAFAKLSEDLGSELEDQRMKINENYMLSLRIAIMNERFPDEFRLEKYDEYKANKGNSFIDKYVKENLLKEGE